MRTPLRSLFISAAVVAALVSAAFVFRPGLGVTNPGVNLVPFSFVTEWLAPRQSASFTYNTLGNFILFVPTAVLLRLAGISRLVVFGAVLGLAAAMESIQLLQGDRVIADVSSSNFNRTDGTWVSDQEIRMPSNSAPGVYTIVTRVSTAQSAISGRAQFTVE